MTPFFLIALGALLLYGGGEVLVRSVTRIAAAFRISPLVISLTVVAFGTSSPEVAVVIGAGVTDKPAIALGNVLGSNIANLALILALAALLRPLVAKGSFLRRDLPFMLATSVLLLPVAWVVGFGRPVAIFLLTLMVAYLVVLFRSGEPPPLESEVPRPAAGQDRWRPIVGVIMGLALLIYGADMLVDAAVEVALGMGVSERVIGLTLVAFGTSLPEMASCLVAAMRRQGDIVLGNLIGSNIFNTLLVLPIGILVHPMTTDSSDLIDIGVMIAVSLVVFLFLYHRTRVGRVEAAALLAAYLGYVAILFVDLP